MNEVIEVPELKNRDWKEEEVQFLLKLRDEDLSIAEIIDKFQYVYGDLLTKNQVHNQLRMGRKKRRGRCYICDKPVTLRARQSRKKRKTFLCSSCKIKTGYYKKGLRDTSLRRKLCGVCRKRVPEPGHKSCNKCRSATHRRRVAQGLCGTCGKNPIDQSRSKTLCTTCLDKNAVNNALARQKRKN